MTHTRALLLALAVLSGAGAAGGGCSLGLDPSLMSSSSRSKDSGVSQRAAGALPDSATSPLASNDAADASAHCTSDGDCAPTGMGNACVTSSRCDPTWHVCMLDVCDVGACSVASCDLLSKQCEAPTSMGFTISVFPVSGGIGGLGLNNAMAAAYPFLFVLTTNGVLAFNVANPTGNVPPMVAVNGLSFIPVAILASGRRVYFVSSVEGAGPTYRQAIAWVDVPGDPFLTSFEASASFIGTTQPSLASVLATPDGLDLVYASAYDPTSTLAPPISDSTMLIPAPIGSLSQNASIVTSSGPRLVAYRYQSTARHPVFALVSGVAQSSGEASPEQAITSYGAVDNQASFASGSDGTVLWESAPLRPLDAGFGDVASARLTLLVPGADGGLFDTAVHADLETYAAPAATYPLSGFLPSQAPTPPLPTQAPPPSQVVGPVAWSDANTTVALAATAEDLTATSVQVFDRSTGALVPGRRGVIPQPPSVLGIAASNGFAYVVAPDDSTNRSAKVYVLAPACSGAATEPSEAGPGDGGVGGGTKHPGGFKALTR